MESNHIIFSLFKPIMEWLKTRRTAFNPRIIQTVTIYEEINTIEFGIKGNFYLAVEMDDKGKIVKAIGYNFCNLSLTDAEKGEMSFVIY